MGTETVTAERAAVAAPDAARPPADYDAAATPETVAAPMPRLWVVSQAFGMPSQIWLERQIRSMRSLAPRAIAWTRGEHAERATRGLDVVWATTEPRPDRGPLRWLRRARHVLHRNYYAGLPSDHRFFDALAADDPPDVILTHFGSIALRVLPIARRLGVPLVAHFHGLDLSSMLTTNPWYRSSLERHLSELDAAVVVGRHQEERLLERGMDAARIHRIPCGAPVPEEGAAAPTPWDGTGHFRFLSVSRLELWKGLDHTLEAFARVCRAGHPVRLQVVGTGSQEERLHEVARRLDLGDRIEFTGVQTDEQVARRIAESHALVQHSITMRPGEPGAGWTEGFGVSITEASIAGLPVVATRSGGIVDQIVDGETGLLVPERDTEAMARAMARLVEEPAVGRRMGARAREHARARFGLEGQVRKLERVLLQAVEDAGARSE